MADIGDASPGRSSSLGSLGPHDAATGIEVVKCAHGNSFSAQPSSPLRFCSPRPAAARQRKPNQQRGRSPNRFGHSGERSPQDALHELWPAPGKRDAVLRRMRLARDGSDCSCTSVLHWVRRLNPVRRAILPHMWPSFCPSDRYRCFHETAAKNAEKAVEAAECATAARGRLD